MDGVHVFHNCSHYGIFVDWVLLSGCWPLVLPDPPRGSLHIRLREWCNGLQPGVGMTVQGYYSGVRGGFVKETCSEADGYGDVGLGTGVEGVSVGRAVGKLGTVSSWSFHWFDMVLTEIETQIFFDDVEIVCRLFVGCLLPYPRLD